MENKIKKEGLDHSRSVTYAGTSISKKSIDQLKQTGINTKETPLKNVIERNSFDHLESMLILVGTIIFDAEDNEMIELDRLFNIFDKPLLKSPSMVIASPVFDRIIEAYEEELKISREGIVKFQDGKVYAIPYIAQQYLTILCSQIVVSRDHWFKVNGSNHTAVDEEDIDQLIKEKETLIKAYFGDSFYHGI